MLLLHAACGQGATDGDDDSIPASTVRTRYERMLKERERRLEGDPDTPGGSQVRSPRAFARRSACAASDLGSRETDGGVSCR